MVAELTHVDGNGQVRMVDVSSKEAGARSAEAGCEVVFPVEVWKQLQEGQWLGRKGSVLQTAVIAGIQAAKRTAEWIPLCHSLALDRIDVELTPQAPDKVLVRSRVGCHARTGVEMEALTAASAAALTLYDMCKALSHAIRINDLKLLRKSGGKRTVGP